MHRGISPPGTAPDEHSVLIVAYPTPSGPSGHLPLTGGVGPGPHYEGRAPVRCCIISGAQKLSGWSKFLPPHWGLGLQKLPLLRFRICAWLCRTNGTWSVNDGRPKGLPYSIKNCLCRTVGEGLAPPVGRSRTGPYAKNAPASLFAVGAAHWAARRFIKTPAPDRSFPLLSGAVCLRGNPLSSPKVPPGCPGTPPSLL